MQYFQRPTIVALLLVSLIPTAAGPASGQEVLTNEEILNMVDAEMSDVLILSIIESRPGDFDLGSESLIELKSRGVSDAVLKAMLDRGSAAGPAPTPQRAVPVDRPVGIPDGTEITLKLKSRISSASAQVDDEVLFESTHDLLVDGVKVIAAGAPARGAVILAQSKKSFGRRGKLDFTIDSVKDVDGRNVRLRATKSSRGKDKYGTAGVVTLLTGPFGFFVKGKDVEIPAGTEYTIFVDRSEETASATAVRSVPASPPAGGAAAPAPRPAAATPPPVAAPSQPTGAGATGVFINGVELSAASHRALQQASAATVLPGEYWYDRVCGAWGYVGGPTAGYILAGLAAAPLAADASNGQTGVFVNGRQLHLVEVLALQSIVGVVNLGRYWFDAQGNYGYEGGPVMGNLWAIAQQSGGRREGILSSYDKTGVAVLGGEVLIRD